MREPVNAPRPGIASADRPRRGPFAELVERILDDSNALDGFAFAYGELETEGRRDLIRAVIQDVPNPGKALGALLAVEPDAGLAADLAGLLRRHGRTESYATLERRSCGGGEACFVRPRLGFAAELFRITWNHNQIDAIEIESGIEMSSLVTGSESPVPMVVEVVAPLLWRHIRAAGALPEGVERFAGFFSVS
jgi:hypothetical protein